MAHKGIIAAGHIRTAEAARCILESGGNAFDAVIAAFWAACAAEPVLASPGGGGYLTGHSSGDSQPFVYDAFTQTPLRRAQSNLDFYPIDAVFGTVSQEFHIGRGSVATPGIVDGIYTIHENHATMPMPDLVAPAAALARDGVAIDDFNHYLLEVVGAIFLREPEAQSVFGSEAQPGKALLPGEILRQPALAQTLENIAAHGKGYFYEGPVADAISRSCAEGGGHLALADFAAYRTIRREPLRIQYRDTTIATNPPPALGGLLVGMALRILNRTRLDWVEPRSPAFMETVARVMAVLNDIKAKSPEHAPDSFAAAEDILDPDLLEQFRQTIARHRLTVQGTTHISVMDAVGNVAALTVSNGAGSGWYLPDFGFMLNNMLGEEDLNPAGFHAWEPGQRMASMMAPTLIERPDGTVFATGSGGSNRIRSAILQVILHLLDSGMDVRDAVTYPRIHYENGALNIEGDAARPAEAVRGIDSVFENITRWPDLNLFFGGAHTTARFADGAFDGAGDPRRGGVCLVV